MTLVTEKLSRLSFKGLGYEMEDRGVEEWM